MAFETSRLCICSPVQLSVPMRPETHPECQSPSNEFFPKPPVYLPSLPTMLAGSLPPPPCSQELLESRDHV